MLAHASANQLICKLPFDSRQTRVIARGVCMSYVCLCSGDVHAVKSSKLLIPPALGARSKEFQIKQISCEL